MPLPGGSPEPTCRTTYPFPEAGKPLRPHPTAFDVEKTAREALGLPPYAPFASEDEWEVTEFIIESNLSQRDTERLLRVQVNVDRPSCMLFLPACYRRK